MSPTIGRPTAPRDAAPAEAPALAALIATAFADLTASRYLVPEPGQRVDVLTRDFVVLVEHGLATGTVHVVDAHGRAGGVAIWADGDDPGPDDYDRRVLDAVGPDRLDRFTRFDALLHASAPRARHAYLAFLAVAPEAQNQGIGSALLRHGLGCLPAGLPAFLVASNERSAGLYRRHGWRRHGPDVVLPNGGRMPPLWRPA